MKLLDQMTEAIRSRPRVTGFLLIACAVAMYLPSWNHAYVFDDKPLFTENIYVQEGWGGIPDLMTSDAFSSQYAQQNAESHLTGGRYRPLSMITFAMEVALTRSWGDTDAATANRAALSHTINIILYGLLCGLIFHVLRSDLFRGRELAAFVVAWIFLLHPIHSEVVVNVKSRDEILSLILILLTLHLAGRRIGACAGVFIVALLAKEYAATLVILAPMYVRLVDPEKRLRPLVMTLGAILLVYIFLRMQLVGWRQGGFVGILNDPYIFANPIEKVATCLFVLLRYVGMLIWPHPLAYDYSYNQVAYRTFTNPWVILSVLVHGGLAYAAIRLALKRSVAGFALFFYGGTILLVSNLFVTTGQMMAERFLFHPSLGFSILVVWGSALLVRKHPRWHIPLLLALLAYTGLAIARVETRIPDWKDEPTLYIHDVKLVPDNTLACCNAGAKFMDLYFQEKDLEKKEWYYNQGMYYSLQAINIYAEDEVSQLNLGLLHYSKGEFDMAETRWNLARAYAPDHPKLPQYDGMLARTFYAIGLEAGKVKDWERARLHLKKTIFYSSSDADALYYLGGTYAEEGNWVKADQAWKMIKPVTWMGFDEAPEYTLPK